MCHDFLTLSLLSPERVSDVNSVPMVISKAPHHTLGWAASHMPREAGLPFPKTLGMCAVDECFSWRPPQSFSWLITEDTVCPASGCFSHFRIFFFFYIRKNTGGGASRRWLTFYFFKKFIDIITYHYHHFICKQAIFNSKNMGMTSWKLY